MKFTQEISIFNPKAIEFAVTSLGTRITQTAAEIRLEAQQTLSNYSTTIQMNSAISQKANEITSEVSETYATIGSVNSSVSSLSSRITQNATAIETKVAKGSVISTINQSAEAVTINASKVNLSGYVTLTNLATSGQTTINGSNITTGTINVNRIASIPVSKVTGSISNSSNWALDFTNGTFTIGNISANNINTGTLTGRDISGGRIFQTVSGAQAGGISGNGSNGQQASIQNGIMTCGELAVKGSAATISIVPEGWDGRSGYGLYCTGHFSTDGAIWTNGEEGSADIICRGNSFAMNFIQSSDRRLKTEITDLDAEETASFIYGLKPVSFRMIESPVKKHHGFIAQDVQTIIDDDWCVVTESDVKLIDGQETLALNYTEIISDLVAVVQSHNIRITELERRNANG